VERGHHDGRDFSGVPLGITGIVSVQVVNSLGASNIVNNYVSVTNPAYSTVQLPHQPFSTATVRS
jgi:hypothetical protein